MGKNTNSLNSFGDEKGKDKQFRAQSINIVNHGKDKKSKAICSVYSLRFYHIISSLSPVQKVELFNPKMIGRW